MKVMSCFNLIWVDKNNPVFMYLSVLFDDKTGKALISLIFQLAYLFLLISCPQLSILFPLLKRVRLDASNVFSWNHFTLSLQLNDEYVTCCSWHRSNSREQLDKKMIKSMKEISLAVGVLLWHVLCPLHKRAVTFSWNFKACQETGEGICFSYFVLWWLPLRAIG